MTSQEPRFGRDWGAFLVLVAVVALFFAPTLTGHGVLFFGDVTNYAPRLGYTGQWLRAGRFPLWNPLLSLGAPHAADPVTLAFYPPNVVLAVLLGARLYDYAAAAHVLLAALGMFGLASALGATRAASLLAAIAYAFSGFTFGHLQHLNVLVAIAWIPIVLATTERYLATGSRRMLALAALAVGLLVLGGHSQFVLYGLGTQGLYCAFRLAVLAREGDRQRLRRLIGGLLALAALGLGLAAVFLLPFAEWMRFVARTDRVTADYATWYSLPTERLLGLIAPLWLGGSASRPREAARLVEWSSYIGLLPLTLAVVALARPSARVLFFLCLGVAALLLALGASTPLYRLILALPAFGSVRAPARFLVLVDLSLALLAAFGLDALRAGKGRWLARIGGLLLLCLCGAVARAAWLGETSVVLLPSHVEPVQFDQPDTTVLLIALLATSGLLWVLAARDRVSRPLLALALVLAAADVFAFRAQLFFYSPAPPGAFEEPSANAEAILRDGGTPRFYTQTGKELENMVYTGKNFEPYLRRMWEGLAGSLPMRFGLQSLTGYLTEPPGHERLLLVVRKGRQFDSRAARIAGVFGVRYVLSSRRRGISAPELTLVTPEARNLYRNSAAMPRVYLVPGSRAARDEVAAFAAVRRAEFDPRQAVVIEGEAPSMPEGPLTFAQAAIAAEEPDRVVIRTTTSRAAWLVLNDAFAPGWKASVDGRPTTILRANGLVRTVAVEAGVHDVVFVYAPASVRWGALISGVALTLIGLLLLPERSRAN